VRHAAKFQYLQPLPSETTQATTVVATTTVEGTTTGGSTTGGSMSTISGETTRPCTIESSRPTALWDGSFSSYVGNINFCNLGYGSGGHYICAGGGVAGNAVQCTTDICMSGQYTFSSQDGWTISTTRAVALNKSPYRAFAYLPFCNGNSMDTCWPGSTTQTFTFSFKPSGLQDWHAYVKLFFWTDGGNILGLLPPGAAAVAGQAETRSQLIFFPGGDYPNTWDSSIYIDDNEWYNIAVEITPVGGTSNYSISVNNQLISSKVLPVNVLGSTNGPQIGQYSFDYAGGSGSSNQLNLSLKNMCLGSAASCAFPTCDSSTTVSPPIVTSAPTVATITTMSPPVDTSSPTEATTIAPPVVTSAPTVSTTISPPLDTSSPTEATATNTGAPTPSPSQGPVSFGICGIGTELISGVCVAQSFGYCGDGTELVNGTCSVQDLNCQNTDDAYSYYDSNCMN